MNHLLKALAIVGAIYGAQAHALLQYCEMNYQVNTQTVFVFQGGQGSGVLRCQDVTGHWYKMPVAINLGGLGLAQMGQCRATGKLKISGVGFAANRIFSIMPNIKLFNLQGGVDLNPLGISAGLAVDRPRLQGQCGNLFTAGLQTVTPMSRYFLREQAHPVPPRAIAQQPSGGPASAR